MGRHLIWPSTFGWRHAISRTASSLELFYAASSFADGHLFQLTLRWFTQKVPVWWCRHTRILTFIPREPPWFAAGNCCTQSGVICSKCLPTKQMGQETQPNSNELKETLGQIYAAAHNVMGVSCHFLTSKFHLRENAALCAGYVNYGWLNNPG